MTRRVLIAVVLAAPFAVATALAILFAVALSVPVRVPDYVVRIKLPTGEAQIGLPKVEGPADASRALVVIDAGHGGHDPGASGQGGEKEKMVTLSLALALRVLERVIARLGGTVPRGRDLASWHDRLAAGEVATLAGVRGDGRGPLWRFARAPRHR